MKIVNAIIIGLVFMISTACFAQQYKFGKVSKVELQEAFNPNDSSADATVLYQKKKIYYNYDPRQGFVQTTEVHKRIKLYTKDGFDYANDEVFLYKGRSSEEKVLGLIGKTYSLLDDAIVETKLDKDGIFKTEDSDNINKVSFTMPALKEGSVIEYKYKILSPFSRSIDRIPLQYNIPIKKIEVSLAIPEYYTFKKRTTGYLPINLKESIDSQSDFIYGKSIDYKVTQYDVKMTKVPAFKKEPYSGNHKNHISTLSFELETTQFPNSFVQNYGTTWGAIARGAYKDSRFGGAMKNTKYFKDDIDQLVSGVSSAIQKTNLIYDFVKKKMTWNNMNALTPRNSMKKVYQEGVGNSAEINLMLIAMLRYVKINAKPILVSTSDKPLSTFPTIQGLDYVVVRTRINDEILFLDATDKFGEPNVLSDQVVHGIGRLITESGASKMILFRPKKISKKQSMVFCEIAVDGSIKGKQRVKYELYRAHDFRVRNASKNDEEQIERLKTMYEVQDIFEYKVNNIEDLGKPVSESFAFETSDEVEIIENEMFFSPLLFLREKENVFKSNERKYPVDFGYGFSDMHIINIKIPEGYEVVELPKSGVFKLPENMGSFSFRSNVTNNTIQLIINETINTALIQANHYLSLKEFYNQVIQKEEQQVVLKKI